MPKSLKYAGAIAPLLTLSAAAADPVELTFEGFGQYGGAVTVAILGAPPSARQSASPWAGQHLYTFGDGSAVRTFSAELWRSPHSDEFNRMHVAQALSLGQSDALHALYNATKGGLVQSSKDATAFQALVWEIVHDFDGSNIASIDLSQGLVQIEGVQSQAFDQFMNTVFAQGRNTADTGLRLLDSGAYQNQLIYQPESLIPLPSAAIMTTGGLLILASRRRR